MTKKEKTITLLISRDVCLSGLTEDQRKEWYNLVADFTINEVGSVLNEQKTDLDRFSPAEVSGFVDVGRDLCWIRFHRIITAQESRVILKYCYEHGSDVYNAMCALDLFQEIAEDDLDKVIEEVVQTEVEAVADYFAGKKKSVGFLIGAIVKKVGKKATPQVIKEKLEKTLEAIKNQ